MSHFTDSTGYVLFIITSFLAGVESTDQCLLNSKVLFCFSGVIMSIRSFILLPESLQVVTHLSYNNSVKCMLFVTTCCIYESTSYIYLFKNFKEKSTFSTRPRVLRDQISQEILVGIEIFLCFSNIYLLRFT